MEPMDGGGVRSYPAEGTGTGVEGGHCGKSWRSCELGCHE